MNSSAYSLESEKVINSTGGLIIRLHQKGYNFDFAIHQQQLICLQNNCLYNYEQVSIEYRDEYYDEITFAYKFIYTIKTECSIMGILICEQANLGNDEKFATEQLQSSDLLNGLDPVTYNLIMGIINKRRKGEDRLLVTFRDKILPISLAETAIFYLENKITRLVLYDGRSYTIQKTMDELEKQAGSYFFRVNRQFIVNKYAIKELSTNLNRTVSLNLSVEFSPTISVSKNRICHFMNWFALNI